MNDLRRHLRRWSGALLCLLLAAITPAAAHAQEPPGGGRAAPGILRLLPEVSQTRHTVQLADRRLDFLAEAGMLPIRDGRGESTAEIFHVSYWLEPHAPERPVTFVFNGGPGAASAFLHLGGIGPRLAAFAPNGEVLPPPARLLDNPDTWLQFTDLVFVDPVGTGYSRTPDPEGAAQFWGVDQDANAMAAFIRLYLTRKNRMTSPVFLVGESYGGFRAAILGSRLPSESGITPSGLVLISPALELALLRGAEDYQPLSWVLPLPSFAAVQLEAEGVVGAQPLADRLEEVERFALSDYMLDLADGIETDAETNAAIAGYTGLPLDMVRERNGRIPTSLFIKAFRRAEGRVLSRQDGAVAGPDPRPADPFPNAPDAVLDRAASALTSAFVQYVRQALRYETDLAYQLLNGEANGRWDFGTTPQRQGYAGALGELQEARALNPALRVMVAHGYTDLVTPYFSSKYLIGQLPPLAGAAPIELRLYEGGHMMYMRPASRRQLMEDARAMYGRP